MRLDNPAHIATVQWYATASYPCSYLPDTPARSQVAVVDTAQAAAQYDALAHKGFRRSGSFIYRPHCDHCQACVPARIRVADFVPSRSQRRAAQTLARFDINLLPLTFRSDHLALYRQYQSSRHDEDRAAMSAAQTQEAYSQFLLRSHVNSNLVELRQPNGALHAVAVVDWLADGVSAVYTFFDASTQGSKAMTYSFPGRKLESLERHSRFDLCCVFDLGQDNEARLTHFRTAVQTGKRLVIYRTVTGLPDHSVYRKEIPKGRKLTAFSGGTLPSGEAVTYLVVE